MDVYEMLNSLKKTSISAPVRALGYQAYAFDGGITCGECACNGPGLFSSKAGNCECACNACNCACNCSNCSI